MNKIKSITKMRLFLPIFSMILVMMINVVYDIACGNPPLSFFSIGITNNILFGRLIDILNRGSEVAILAIGMTLVVSSSAGTDISVGLFLIRQMYVSNQQLPVVSDLMSRK